jgi:imidazolonepropionase-like amidohydrolase
VLGASEQIGSLEAGKRADLVAFAGAPLDTSTAVAWVISGGAIVYNSGLTAPEQVAASSTSEAAEDLRTVKANRLALKTRNFLLPSGKTAPRVVIINRNRGTFTAVAPKEFKPAKGVKVVDIGDAWLTPGLISSHANLGLSQLVDPRLSDASYVVAGDAVSPDFASESELVQSGLLRVLLAPGNSNTISGACSLIRLGAKTQVAERVAAVKFAMLPSARTSDRFPSSLAGQAQLIKESLSGKLLDTRLYIPEAARERLAMERTARLKSVADGNAPCIITVSSDAEIRAALDVIEKHKLDAAIVGPAQLAPFVERLKKLKVTVIAQPATVSDYDWYTQDLADAANAGVRVVFAGENAEQLRLTAALASQSGMSARSALAALCYGSPQFGNDSKAADLIVWTGSPLSLSSEVQCVLVDGEAVTAVQR